MGQCNLPALYLLFEYTVRHLTAERKMKPVTGFQKTARRNLGAPFSKKDETPPKNGNNRRIPLDGSLTIYNRQLDKAVP